MIKMLALDLDDTLLMPDCTIPSDVISVLQNTAVRYDVKIVIATGRIYPSARIYAEQLGTKSHIICYNGAMIREIGKETLIYCRIGSGSDPPDHRILQGKRSVPSDVSRGSYRGGKNL